MQRKAASRTNKLPSRPTKYRTSESLALGHIGRYIKHYNDHGSRKGMESMKVTQIP